ncbi:hypothetical protein PUNSTDRAFT_139755 [Punctularia strigosozonata HHB-11173 SS5]|uniref:Uncharacterized protein n=2 Tax=Punctularia strigosozonata (strain HHB-11173) TaxID=741275 RepID=R7RYQ9_PUNST|nr:uncharacterized protein PUNSTDRAFT_139755 [Punctularia strigosozonata HHB-11173 SS5]EIN03225.1 hypothetical protein PUNSTDRAFT_139755 [Punctularia strigosozonata HHB-11173 SS5]
MSEDEMPPVKARPQSRTISGGRNGNMEPTSRSRASGSSRPVHHRTLSPPPAAGPSRYLGALEQTDEDEPPPVQPRPKPRPVKKTREEVQTDDDEPPPIKPRPKPRPVKRAAREEEQMDDDEPPIVKPRSKPGPAKDLR